MKVFLRKTDVSWRLRGLLLARTSKKANLLPTSFSIENRMLGTDVIVKGNSILFSLKYTESVIDLSSIGQNLRSLIVLYPIPLVMSHEKIG